MDKIWSQTVFGDTTEFTHRFCFHTILQGWDLVFCRYPIGSWEIKCRRCGGIAIITNRLIEKGIKVAWRGVI